jgi:23S rRNA A2030 N6-methylase RlmJ
LSLLEETPEIVFVDTHAGTGMYTLSKHGEEARNGILKLMTRSCQCIQMSPSLQDYLSLVQSFQPKDHPNDSLEYPGSPLLVKTILKTYAKKYWHYSFEWNPSQYEWLQKSLSTSSNTSSNTNIDDTDAGADVIQCSDGYEGAVNILEQSTAAGINNRKQDNHVQQKHTVIFIDPPYKDLIRECSQVEKTVQKLLHIHARCTIMVWIPNLPSPLDPKKHVPKLIERLKEMARQFHSNKITMIRFIGFMPHCK